MKLLLRPALLSGFLALAAVAAKADPVQVVYNGVTYDITTENLDYSNATDRALLQSQVWYTGDNTTDPSEPAHYFATSVGTQLGGQSGTSVINSALGVFFLYDAYPGGFGYDLGLSWETLNGGYSNGFGNVDGTITYAIATVAGVPDNALTVTLLGAALVGLALFRRRSVTAA